MRWARCFLLAVVAALGVWALVALHPNPERQVRRRLDSLARAASFGPNQGYLAKLAGAERLADFCATNVEVNIDLPGRQEQRLAGREDIQRAALAARVSAPGLAVSFPDVAVQVGADRKSAEADVTVQAQVAGERDLIAQEVKITLRKVGGQWFLAKVETVRTLK